MIGRAGERTSRPMGVNLVRRATEDRVDEVRDAAPAVLSTAWPRDDQDLSAVFARAHERGIRVMHMVPRVDDAVRAAEAGADVIVAQGSEGGGHVGEIGTSVIVRQGAQAVTPIPVLAAGGVVGGGGLGEAGSGRGLRSRLQPDVDRTVRRTHRLGASSRGGGPADRGGGGGGPAHALARAPSQEYARLSPLKEVGDAKGIEGDRVGLHDDGWLRRSLRELRRWLHG